MADSMNIYKSLNVSTGPVMKNPEMLINILDQLKQCVSMQLRNYLIY